MRLLMNAWHTLRRNLLSMARGMLARYYLAETKLAYTLGMHVVISTELSTRMSTSPGFDDARFGRTRVWPDLDRIGPSSTTFGASPTTFVQSLPEKRKLRGGCERRALAGFLQLEATSTDVGQIWRPKPVRLRTVWVRLDGRVRPNLGSFRPKLERFQAMFPWSRTCLI